MPSADRMPTNEVGVAPARALGVIGEGLAEISLRRDATNVSLAWGGDAANISVMAARLGVPVRLAGRVGGDALGRGLRAFWQSNGVDVSSVREDPEGATGLYLNESADEGGHRFIYHRQFSAGSRLAPEDVSTSFIDDLGVLVVTGVTLAVSRSSAAAARAAIATARTRGTRIACVLNHRPALGGDVDELAELGRASDILIASREDLEHVFGSVEAAARALGDGPSELVVTAGAEPAVVTSDSRVCTQEIPEAVTRNAAGAGDALAGAYLACRLRGQNPARSLAWGVAAATLSVGRDGCASGYPTSAETAALVDEMSEAGAVRSE